MWLITGTRPRCRRPDPTDGRSHRAAGSARPPAPQTEDHSELRADKAIECAICGAVITHQDQALAINNRHQHAFFNPAGIAFELRLFRRAPGVSPQGEASADFTWFPGYQWQIVLCTVCRSHLGWLFSADQTFFGLIANRLR